MNTENDTQSTQTMNNTAGQPPAGPAQVTANAANPAPDPPPPPQPFDRQPGESGKAFAAFRAYLEMGPTRSVCGAARRRGLKPKHFIYWARRFQWRDRSAAYEEHLAQVRRQAQEEALRQQTIDWTHRSRLAHEQQWQLAQTTLEAAHNPEAPDPQGPAATLQKPPQDTTIDKSQSEPPQPKQVTTADSLTPPYTVKSN